MSKYVKYVKKYRKFDLLHVFDLGLLKNKDILNNTIYLTFLQILLIKKLFSFVFY